MVIREGVSYTVTVRMPWGELRRYTTTAARRESDGTLTWNAEGWVGLEPRLDCPITETEGWIMGWLGGSCDTVVVISTDPDAPLP